MSRLNRFVTSAVSVFRPLPQTMLDNSYSRATTPDQIICAAVMQSFVKDFDDWTGIPETHHHYWENEGPSSARIVNSKKEITIAVKYGKASRNINNNPDRYTSYVDKSVIYINQMKIEGHLATQVLCAWFEISKKMQDTIDAANTAKAKMEADEKKWNLAEKLLGMKRNEHGALVPVVNADGRVNTQIEEGVS